MATMCQAGVNPLGGRPITRASLKKVFKSALDGALEPVSFLDLNLPVVERQLERERLARRTGPAAEAILRDMNAAPATAR